ncbi:hypothetical protein PS1_026010 [Malus domestica]
MATNKTADHAAWSELLGSENWDGPLGPSKPQSPNPHPPLRQLLPGHLQRLQQRPKFQELRLQPLRKALLLR